MGLLKGHGTCHFIYILQICEQKLSLIDCSVVWLFSCDGHRFFIYLFINFCTLILMKENVILVM